MASSARRQKQVEGKVHFRTHSEDLMAHARELRVRMTDTEKRLWGKLSRNQTGHAFRRQHPIGPYIVDFICIKQRLVIELDGGQHNRAVAIDYDVRRTELLNGFGYRVLRFWNHEVMENLAGVYEVIFAALSAVSANEDPHPSSP